MIGEYTMNEYKAYKNLVKHKKLINRVFSEICGIGSSESTRFPEGLVLGNSGNTYHSRNVGVDTRPPETSQRSNRGEFLKLPPRPYK
jgi:hypothetical protein